MRCNEEWFDVGGWWMKVIERVRSNVVKWGKDNMEVIGDEC